MTLEEVMAVIKRAWKEKKEILRLHTGDPCIYGAIREQMDAMDKEKIPYESAPALVPSAEQHPLWGWNIRFREFPRA